MRWIGWLVVPMVACTGEDVGDEGIGTDEPQPEDTAPEVVEDRSAALSANLVDESGAPVIDAGVRFCRGPVCLTAVSDGTGDFGFDNVIVGWHSLEVIPPMDSTGLATAFVPVQFATDESRTIDLTMPPLDAATALTGTAQAIQTGAGLQIELAEGDLEPPTFIEPATEVAGVRLTEAQHVPVDDEDGTVVAQWFLEPFDHTATVDIPMTFSNDYALADGTELRVIVGDYTTSQWLEAGTLTVTGGELEGDVNLPVTSTVVLMDVTAN
ncbi:MAG: hypothetical protein AAF211_03415 [Myxococcota bacterium]